MPSAPWEEFTRRLETQFTLGDQDLIARGKLQHLRQTGSVMAYAAEFRKWLVFVTPPMDERSRIYSFINGLKIAIRKEVRPYPTTLEDAVTKAIDAEMLLTTLSGVPSYPRAPTYAYVSAPARAPMYATASAPAPMYATASAPAAGPVAMEIGQT